MPKNIKKLNLALQGGGAHGALSWGILDKILEDGRIQFDSISATSAGAMNAVVLAYGLTKGGNEGAREALHDFWKAISEAGEQYNPIKTTALEDFFGISVENSMSYFVFDMLSKTFSPYQSNPMNFNPLRDILEKHVDFDLLKKSSALKLFISATNVKTGKIKVFEHKEISLDAVMASACLPLMFQAVQVKDEFFWDGGYMGNPAIFPLIYNSKTNDILIIHINPIIRDNVPQTPAEILNRMNEISFNSSLMREMRAINFVGKMLKDGWVKDEYAKNMKDLSLHAIRADLVMKSYSVASKLDPDWSFLKQLFELGRIEGELWLKDNFRHIGKQSSIDINEYL
ncbi:MAG: patatin-like phospholipase family protein [bacterium]|nr:patatin-like phospholipase family protein [bacterium]